MQIMFFEKVTDGVLRFLDLSAISGTRLFTSPSIAKVGCKMRRNNQTKFISNPLLIIVRNTMPLQDHFKASADTAIIFLGDFEIFHAAILTEREILIYFHYYNT